jgi:hypothetical protein
MALTTTHQHAIAAAAARAQLLQQTWTNTAFAPQAAASSTQVPALDIAASPAFPALCSVRFSGTIVDAAATELLAFSVLSDGGVRLWVDEWLVIDAGGNRSAPAPQLTQGFLRVPFTRGSPRALRLEYSRWGGAGAATLQLSWSGNSTALAIVPAAAFAPAVSDFIARRAALRDRLEVPRVPWQTYAMASMGAHVLMPAGLALHASLAVAGAGSAANASLGPIVPFRNGHPALVRPGLRSINGSDYTLLTISQWAPAGDAVVTFETTVDAGGALVFLARCAGAGCADLHLLVQPQMMQERAGALSVGADGHSLRAELPGFPAVAAVALAGGGAPAPWAPAAQPCLALPLASGAAGFWAGSSGNGSGVPLPPDVPAAQAAIAAAAAAAAASLAPYGALAPLWEGAVSVIAWSTIYTPYEGVVTPVSHIMGNIWSVGYILFNWDTYFLALMASLQPGILRDISYANLIQVTLGRTLLGFVPNGAAGPRKTYDRSEDEVGARVLRAIVEKTGDAWLLEGLLPVMLAWNDWEWARRRGEGVLAGADGFADLFCLGSDPSSPRSDTEGTMQAARYEGMDNSAIYDAPPASYNRTTGHMDVYDVAATALFASDTEATIALCAAAGSGACAAATPPLPERLARVQAAMNAHMWDEGAGLYANLLFNGTALGVYAPTSVFPMLSGAASDAQAAALAAALASPRGFCLNASHAPAPAADVLVQWAARGAAGRPAACVTPACTASAIFAGLSVRRVEAAVLLPSGGPAPGLVPLTLFADPASGNTALVDGAAPPDANFSQLVRQEGWAWAAPPPSGWPAANLSLWRSAAAREYMTCGTADCVADAAAQGFAFVRAVGWAWNATGPDNMPCKVAGPSVARADASFLDQGYWRGRAWAPHHMLIYWALARYDHVPAARAARLDLVAMGARTQLENWAVGVVCENVNGLIGTCEDSGNADPFYTWGALFGFTSLVEAGLY